MAGFATAILPGQEALFTLPPRHPLYPIGGSRLRRHVPEERDLHAANKTATERVQSGSRRHGAVLAEEGPRVHSVAVPTDPRRSDAGVTGASTPPIGRYRRVPVEVHEADPDAPEA